MNDVVYAVRTYSKLGGSSLGCIIYRNREDAQKKVDAYNAAANADDSILIRAELALFEIQ